MDDINRIVADYHPIVNFLFVYILEAHAADEWPIKELEEEIFQHKSVDDRLEAARNFVSQYHFHQQLEVVVDNEDNVFIEQYSSWPFRYWGFKDGRIGVKEMPEKDLVSLDGLIDWLSTLRSQMKSTNDFS